MAAGGRRTGAGRPKGSVSRANEEVRSRALATGETPLDYMLSVMRDPRASARRRDDMAKAAAPYVHARIATKTNEFAQEPFVVQLGPIDMML